MHYLIGLVGLVVVAWCAGQSGMFATIVDALLALHCPNVVNNVLAFKPIAALPDLLTFENGTKVTTRQHWLQRRQQIKDLFIEYYIGTFPSTIPSITNTSTIREIPFRGGNSKILQIFFDTKNKANFTMEVMIPDGEGPFPVFMTQYTHRFFLKNPTLKSRV
jgi:hypothetical protein